MESSNSLDSLLEKGAIFGLKLGLSAVFALGAGCNDSPRSHDFDPSQSIEGLSDSAAQKIHDLVRRNADLCIQGGAISSDDALHEDLRPIIGEASDFVSSVCSRIPQTDDNFYRFSVRAGNGFLSATNDDTTTNGKDFFHQNGSGHSPLVLSPAVK